MSVFRVLSGWSYFEDFDTREEAIGSAAMLLATPVHDPLLRRVEVIDLKGPRTPVGMHPTILTGEREVRS